MIRYSYMFIDTRAIFAGDLSPTFDLVRSCGYEGVELNLFPGLIEQSDRLQQALDTNGLTVPAVLTGAAYNDGLCLSSADQSVRQGAVEYLIDCLEIAQRFQSILVVGLLQGLRSDEPDPVVANRRIVDGLQRVGRLPRSWEWNW
jgi:sugar phosphate isomerase/epimerase